MTQSGALRGEHDAMRWFHRLLLAALHAAAFVPAAAAQSADATTVVEVLPLAQSLDVPPEPSRICDLALEAIQRIQGKDLRREFLSVESVAGSYVSPQQAESIRDRLIAALRARLAGTK